jgi:CheY-like chemotaxis protein
VGDPHGAHFAVAGRRTHACGRRGPGPGAGRFSIDNSSSLHYAPWYLWEGIILNRKYKVLLAEDEVAINRLIRRYLEILGFEVVAATNGREALDLYRSEAPDLLLSDVNMPEMNGLELLSSIRATGRPLPAILFSGMGDPEPVGRLRDYRFLNKPVSLESLRQEINLAIAS